MLSDDLVLIGIEANPKSNMEMGRQALKMHEKIKKMNSFYSTKKLVNCTKCAIKDLNDLGYMYYKFELFFKKINHK